MSFVRRFSFLSVAFAVACGGSAGPSPSAPMAPVSQPVSAPSAVGARPVIPPWSDAESPVPVTSADPFWGRRDAPVTIVVFSDFQCPYCARVESVFAQIKTSYGPDKVRLVWKNEPLPFHTNARPAALAAQAVFELGGSEAFWKFHEAAFRGQRELSPENFERWAVGAGIDAAAFRAELASPEVEAKVAEDERLAGKIGAYGTPTSFVNGVAVSGAQPFEAFQKVIDAELAKSSERAAAGTPSDRIYVAASKDNYKQPTSPEEEDEEADDTTVWKVPVGKSPVRGKADAPVTLVVFSDFQCPFCKRVEPTLAKVRETYGGKVRIVWKDEPLPFHPRAKPAAELARFARSKKGDAGFWDVHDRLFASQPALEDDDLASVAKAAGLDPVKALAAVKAESFKKDIAADQSLADDVQANGTPHFFVNGRRLVGAQPFEKFAALVDEELKKFDEQKGKIAAKDYYDALMKTAKGVPEPPKVTAPKVTATSPVKGAADAKVVIQEWADFQCPYCARVDGTLAEILKNYGGKVKLVWRDKPLPFHANAQLAAEAAREAFAQKGNAGFWQMHDKLFADPSRLERADLEAYAKEIGLDATKFAAALDAHTHAAAVRADDALGATFGIAGTPSFLINDYALVGAQPYDAFEKLVVRALDDAKGAKK